MSDATPISETVVMQPSARLTLHVERYVGYRYRGFPPGLHRGLPSRHLTFIISLDQPVEMRLAPAPEELATDQPPQDQAAQDRPADGPLIAMQAFVGGLQTWPAHIFHNGTQEGIAVDLTPLGAQALFGVPGGELAGRVVSLDDLLGPRGAHVTERLLNAPDWPTRFRLLDAALAAGCSERHLPAPAVQYAWDTLVRRPGDLDVSSLAQEIGWSRRHLSEQVRRQTGLPPRQLARILRFERSCALLREPAGRSRTMTGIALEAGYFDHAHMLHEWQRLAGCTPAAWLGEVLPPVQDETWDHAAS